MSLTDQRRGEPWDLTGDAACSKSTTTTRSAEPKNTLRIATIKTTCAGVTPEGSEEISRCVEAIRPKSAKARSRRPPESRQPQSHPEGAARNPGPIKHNCPRGTWDLTGNAACSKPPRSPVGTPSTASPVHRSELLWSPFLLNDLLSSRGSPLNVFNRPTSWRTVGSDWRCRLLEVNDDNQERRTQEHPEDRDDQNDLRGCHPGGVR